MNSPVPYELRGFWVKLLPGFIKHLKVIFTQRLAVLGLEGLQDDGEVQADHQQERQADMGDEEDNGDCRAATVPPGGGSWVPHIGITVWLRAHDGSQEPPPWSWGSDHQQADHATPKRLKIKHVVHPDILLHIAEVQHAEEGGDEHEDDVEEPNVEEGRKWHHKGIKQLSDARDPGEDAKDMNHSQHSEERRIKKEFTNKDA